MQILRIATGLDILKTFVELDFWKFFGQSAIALPENKYFKMSRLRIFTNKCCSQLIPLLTCAYRLMDSAIPKVGIFLFSIDLHR